MQYQWRVTKYNPAKRNAEGHYLEDEWSEITDLGKKFGGKIFEVSDYLEVENKYVDAAVQFLNETGEANFTLSGWRKYKRGNDTMKPYHLDMLQDFEDNQILPKELLPVIIKMLLRDIAHCHIEIIDKFFIHIGWNSYMYIGSAIDLPTSVLSVNKAGLFVEPFLSPYLEDI